MPVNLGLYIISTIQSKKGNLTKGIFLSKISFFFDKYNLILRQK